MEEYRVYCTLNFKNGDTSDVSSLVREIRLLHSVNFAVPVVEIHFNRNSSIDYTQVSSAEVQIYYYGHDEHYKHIDKISLVNIGFPEHDINVPTGNVQTVFSNQGSAVLQPLTLYFKSVYHTVNTTVGPVLKTNINIKDLIKDILPKNCKLSKYSLIDENRNIDQVFVPKLPFLKALNYLDYWFGLDKTTIFTILPEPNDDVHCSLILENVNKALKSGLFDKIIFFRQGHRVPLTELAAEPSGKVFVSDYPFKVQHNIIPKRKFSIITKPDKKLYSKVELDEMYLINNYSAVYKSFCNDENKHLEEEYLKIINHTGGIDGDPTPVLSSLAIEHSFATRIIFRLAMIPTIQALFPTQRINVIVTDPAQAVVNGIWLVESTEYVFSRHQTRSWTLNVEVSAFRSNFEPKDCGKGLLLDIYNFKEIPLPRSPVLESFNDNLRKQSQYVKSRIDEALSQLLNGTNNINSKIETVNSDINNLKEHYQTIMSSQQFSSDIVQTTDSMYNTVTNIINTLQNAKDSINNYSSSKSDIINMLKDTLSDYQDLVTTADMLPDENFNSITIPNINDVMDVLNTNNDSSLSVLTDIDSLFNQVNFIKDKIEPFHELVHRIDTLDANLDIKSDLLNKVKEHYIKNIDDIVNHELFSITQFEDFSISTLQDFAKDQLGSIVNNMYSKLMEELV